jgi:hypothetical protein
LPPGDGHGIAKELMMAGRKKGPPVPPPEGERAFAVAVEQLRGEFKVFGGALGGLREEMTELRQDVTELRQQVTDGFASVDRRFERVEHELGEVRVDLALVKSAATTHSRELREIRSALGNKVERGEVEAIVEHVVARIAER